VPNIENTESYRFLKKNAVKNLLPLTALVELTYKCNLDCICCYNVRNEKPLLTLQEYDVLFSDLRKEGTFILTLSGGEPLMRKDFFDILDLVRKHGFGFRIFTNGTLLNEEKIIRLKSYPLIGIEMSLWGSNPEINDKLMGKPGAFSQIISTAQRLKKHGIPFTIKTTICADNYSDFGNIKKLVENLGADFRYTPWLTMRLDGDSANMNFRLNEDQARAFYKIHDEAYADQDPAAQRKKNLRESTTKNSNEYMCLAGISTFALTPFGDVFPCVDIPVNAGNIREKGFREIWKESAIMKKLRRLRKSDAAGCTECGLKPYCARCPGIALVETGDLTNPFPYACLLARVEKEI